LNIGFVSTRLAGTDGVSLETAKLARVLRRMGHEVFYCAGELDDEGLQGRCVPSMHFRDPQAIALGTRAFGGTQPDPTLIEDIGRCADALHAEIGGFIREFAIDLLVIENALAIPMQLPLAQALSDIITATGLPTIAHHHDFYWERDRFRVNRIPEFLDTYLPFDGPSVRHVVINSLAQHDLRERRGIDATVLPNVLDFSTPPPGPDAFNSDLRENLGLSQDHLVILQPTRIVPRKGIELSIELVRRMREPANLRRLGREPVLVITHGAGDEGMDYLHKLERLAQAAEVPLIHAASSFAPRRSQASGRKVYSLWDAYLLADFVTYPSLYEGFGNALLEAIYFRLPTLVNRYSVYVADIAPIGLDLIEIEGHIGRNAVEAVVAVVTSEKRRQRMVDTNFDLGGQHFSFELLEERLRTLVEGI
jgi:glycosyltransferase involved in cell wall biosynthesis